MNGTAANRMRVDLCLLIIAGYWTAAVSGFSETARNAVLRRDPIGRITQLDRSKLDPTVDSNFYARPNLVTHADDAFLAKVTNLYKDLLPDEAVVLDIMSSHVSHLTPPANPPNSPTVARLDVHGMNADELKANPFRKKTGGLYLVRNLNENPSFLGFGETACYDAALCCCSVQYLQEAEQVFAEVARILKPGGKVIVSFTNRFFSSKSLDKMDRTRNEETCETSDRLSPGSGRIHRYTCGWRWDGRLDTAFERGWNCWRSICRCGWNKRRIWIAVVGTRDESP